MITNKNNQQDNSIVFFKFYRNVFINKIIFDYINYLNKVYGHKRIFKTLEEYLNCGEKDRVNNIVIKSFRSKEELLEFVKDAPENLYQIEVSCNVGLTLDFGSLVISPTIKKIQFSNGIVFKNYNYGRKSDSGFGDNGGRKSLKSVSLGIGCDEFLKSPQLLSNLNHLNLYTEIFGKDPLKKGMLPDNLQSLSIVGYYGHSSMYLPKQLKTFKTKNNGYGYNVYSAHFIQFLPDSLTSLKLSCYVSSYKVEFNKKLSNSLIKLTVLYDCFLNLKNKQTIFNKDDFGSLTSLNLSYSSLESIIDIDALPPTLKKLKLWSNAVCKSSSRGYPASLTSLSGNLNHYLVSFQNPLNLKESKIEFSSSVPKNLDHKAKFTQFENLESLNYSAIISLEDIFLLNNSNQKQVIDRVKNLEITCISNIVYQQSELNFQLSLLSNLNTIKLDSYLTAFLFKSSTILPSSLKVLDINVSSLFDQPNQIFLTAPQLPMINSLIIRGERILSNEFLDLLPVSLQHIFILITSNNLKNGTALMQRFSNLIRYYYRGDFLNKNNTDSYLYKKFKNQFNK